MLALVLALVLVQVLEVVRVKLQAASDEPRSRLPRYCRHLWT